MRVFLYFARAYPWQSLPVLACLLLAGVLDGIGLSTLLPLISLATGGAGEGAAATGFEATVREGLASVGIEPALGPLLGLIVVAIWAKAALVLLANRQVGYTVARVATDLRLSLLRALLATRWGYFTRQPIGGVANAMATEANRASLTFEYLAIILTYAIEAGVYLLIALAISWRATLVAGVAAAAMVWLLGALVRMSARAGRRQTLLLRSLLSRLTDALHAVKLLKATGREQSVAPLLAADTERLDRQLRKRVLSKEALRALQDPILVTFVCSGIFFAIAVLGMALSSILVLVLTFARTLSKVNSVQSKYQSMSTEASALWSIVSMIEDAQRQEERTGGEAPPALTHSLALRDVHLRYGDQVVLAGASLEIPAGRITAVVGPSGTGKTTIVDLLIGLVEPQAGSVLIDGVPLSRIDLARWRQCIGYVPQETLLLHDSIRTNVTFGDSEIDDARVEAALRDADAWEFVSSLPEGLDHSVGERGTLLSGGQRQRIAIARAIVHRPSLLILDEATAALDAESEAAVWRTVARLRGRTTVVAISHQPALTTVAERIYRLEDGRVRDATATRGAREVA